MSALDANFELISSMQRPNLNASNRLNGRPSRQRSIVTGRAVSNSVARRRISLVLAVVFIAVAMAFAMISNQPATATDSQASVSVHYATVASGESLWAVAERVAPNVDPRDWIDQVMDLNSLNGADVVAGQRLVVPQN
jgi:LysM repeat protein